MSERYPLWCVDRGEDFGEERYSGPYDTAAQAANACLHRSETGGDAFEIRRCRRIKASEVNFDPRDLIGGLNYSAHYGELPAGALADRHVDTVRAKDKNFSSAFWALTDEHLVVDAFVCEGDE